MLFSVATREKYILSRDAKLLFPSFKFCTQQQTVYFCLEAQTIEIPAAASLQLSLFHKKVALNLARNWINGVTKRVLNWAIQ